MTYDYTWLQGAVAEFLNRADLYASIPTFIGLAEAQMNRRLLQAGVQGGVTRASASISAEFENVPSDFDGLIDAQIYDTTQSRWLPLEPVTPTGMATLKASREATAARPDRIAVVGTAFQFSPTPDQTYSVDLSYYAKISALSATNTTNWVLTDNPDAYLYGALGHAAPYLSKTDARIPLWKAMFDVSLAEIVAAERDKRGPRFTPSYRASDVPPNFGRRRFGFNINTGQ